MTINARIAGHTVTRLLAAADKHGATLPKGTRADLDAALDVARRADAYAVKPADLPGAIVDALAAGRDPLEDRAVIAAAVSDRVGNVMPGARERAAHRIVATIKEHIDDTVQGFAPVWDANGAALTDHLRHLPGGADFLTADPRTVARHSPDTLRHWTEARAARDTLTELHTVLVAALEAAGRPHHGPVTACMFYDGATSAHDLTAHIRQANPAQAAETGLRFSLTTTAHARDRYQAVIAADDADAQAAAEFRRAQRSAANGTDNMAAAIKGRRGPDTVSVG